MQTAFPGGPSMAGIGAGYGQSTYPAIAGVQLDNASQLSYPNAFNNNTTSRFQMAANSIWKMSVLDDSEWLTTRILPKRKVDGTSVMFQETRMHPTLMEPNPEWSQAKLVSLSRRQKITRLNRWGLQLEIEINMAQDPYGQQAFALYIETIQRAFEDTLAVDVIAELFNANIDSDRKMLKMNIYRDRSAWDAMQTEILYYHALQKLTNPLESIDAKISEEMGLLRGKFNTIILPSQARAYIKTAKNQYLDYKLAGPAGPALARSDIHENARAGAYPGIGESIEIYSIKRTHALSELTSGKDIMSMERTIGEYYVMQSSMEWDDARWTPECQAIKIYDEERGDYKLLRMDEIVRHSKTFDENTGDVIPLAKLDFNYDVNKDKIEGENVMDMFTNQVTGNAVKRFGEIDAKFLSAAERVRWARGFVKRDGSQAGKSLQTTYTEMINTLEMLSVAGTGAPVNYLSEKVITDGLATLTAALARCFPSAIYLSPAASPPTSSVSSAAGAFLYNVVIPHYLPAFKTTGGSEAGVNSQAGLLLLDQIFNDTATAVAAIDAAVKEADANRQALMYSEVMKRINTAIHIYALRSVQPGVSVVPDYANVDAVKDAADKAFKGSDAMVKKVETKAWDLVKNFKVGDWTGVGADKVVVVKDEFFSPQQLREVYARWTDKNLPGKIPADPDFPLVPITRAKLAAYVGSTEFARNVNIASAYHPTTPHVMSLIGQHVQSVREAEEHGHTEHMEQHAYIAAHGSSHLHSLIETARQASISAGMTPWLMAPGGTEQDLEILTGSAWTKMHKQVHDLSTPLERIIVSLFNQSSVTMDTLLRWNVCGLPMPFAALVMRPDITHITASAIAVWRGEETGYTAVGQPLWTYAMNMGSQSQGGHFSVYSRAIITAPQNVYVVPNIMITGYVRGNSCDWIKPESRRNGQKPGSRESLYAVLIPVISCQNDIRPVISTTGRILDVPYFNEAGVMEEDPFPQHLRFVKTHGTYDDNVTNVSDENGIIPANVVCLPGQYLVQGEKGFTEMKAGMGHLGDTNGPNAKQVRSSALLSYEKDTGAINRYV
jgi:hypothetical protein